MEPGRGALLERQALAQLGEGIVRDVQRCGGIPIAVAVEGEVHRDGRDVEAAGPYTGGAHRSASGRDGGARRPHGGDRTGGEERAARQREGPRDAAPGQREPEAEPWKRRELEEERGLQSGDCLRREPRRRGGPQRRAAEPRGARDGRRTEGINLSRYRTERRKQRGGLRAKERARHEEEREGERAERGGERDRRISQRTSGRPWRQSDRNPGKRERDDRVDGERARDSPGLLYARGRHHQLEKKLPGDDGERGCKRREPSLPALSPGHHGFFPWRRR